MPGRLLSTLVRSSSPSTTLSLSNSSNSSLNEIPSSTRRASDHVPPERRLSFSMEHFIHPHRDHLNYKGKRIGLGRVGRSKDGTPKGDGLTSPVKLDMITESPPLVFYGPPASSTGALFSGRLRVVVPATPGGINLQNLTMTLTSTVRTRKPVARDCRQCSMRVEELFRWDFLAESIQLKPGDHDFPFSYLFPGHLAATTHGLLGDVEYLLSAKATPSTGEEFTWKTSLLIQRAILPSHDRTAIRIFPPTQIMTRVVLPSVVHPIGTFPVQMMLSGIVAKGAETRWRLCRMAWRIEEHEKMMSVACDKHTHQLGSEGKDISHEDIRVIGYSNIKDGWKSDFEAGEITMEFDASIRPGRNPVCDLAMSQGLEVSHYLSLEMVIAEEIRSTKGVSSTGAARVLRMQFRLPVTERSGLGISWDEEMPPVYDDVPASPPGYFTLDTGCAIEDYQGPLPDYEELERVDSLRLDQDLTTSSSSLSEHLPLSRPQTRLTSEDLIAEPWDDPHPEENEAAVALLS
ncbi:hypothetical protein Egran_00353 [Elaphomyces granulatus]|uniref:LDB19 N-terminal domain-containing protein n=1 Tax=Elaphomyces granulatus TaxID=519963 RepID=A0A232M6G3_9EURO|nr:hypothetical protein Egran_00353 [Elaphomyces granulatus]